MKHPLGGIFNMWSFCCWKSIIRVLKICFFWQKLASSTYSTWDNTDEWERQYFRHINQMYLNWELWYSSSLILRGWRKQTSLVAPESLSGLIPLLNQTTDSHCKIQYTLTQLSSGYNLVLQQENKVHSYFGNFSSASLNFYSDLKWNDRRRFIL